MDAATIERLLKSEESNLIDFKVSHYDLTDEKKKGDLIKDIMAFANTRRSGNAYIVIGVKNVVGGPNILKGISPLEMYDDSRIQSIVNAKMNSRINFLHKIEDFDSKKFAIITIYPHIGWRYLTESFNDKVARFQLYTRLGTTNDCLTPDAIFKMGADSVIPTPKAIAGLLNSENISCRYPVDVIGFHYGDYKQFKPKDAYGLADRIELVKNYLAIRLPYFQCRVYIENTGDTLLENARIVIPHTEFVRTYTDYDLQKVFFPKNAARMSVPDLAMATNLPKHGVEGERVEIQPMSTHVYKEKLYFRFQKSGTFNIPYSIYANNLAKPVEGEFSFNATITDRKFSDDMSPIQLLCQLKEWVICDHIELHEQLRSYLI